MAPELPTTQPWVASLKATPNNWLSVPELSVPQCAPPSTVAWITPFMLAAQP